MCETDWVTTHFIIEHMTELDKHMEKMSKRGKRKPPPHRGRSH